MALHNYIGATALPVLRYALDTSQGQTSANSIVSHALSTTYAANDTMTVVNTASKVSYTFIPGRDGFKIEFTVLWTNAAPALNWDVKWFTFNFAGIPQYDSKTPTVAGTFYTSGALQNGWDAFGAQNLAVYDPGTTDVAPLWMLWYCDDPNPACFHFSSRYGRSVTQQWDLYLSAETTAPAAYSGFPLQPNVPFKTSIRCKFFPADSPPSAVSVAAGSYSNVRTKYPTLRRDDLFPPRSMVGSNFMATAPSQSATAPPYPANPRCWFDNHPAYNYWDPVNSVLLAKSGDLTGLIALRNTMVGRIKFSNRQIIEAHNNFPDGAKVTIHWDLFDGTPGPQPGQSYVGDPPASRGDPPINVPQVPELWFTSTAWPVSIAAQMAAVMQTSDLAPGLDKTIFPGIGLRADIYTLKPGTLWKFQQDNWPDVQGAVDSLSAKIQLAYSPPFNCRAFYVDSYGPFDDPNTVARPAYEPYGPAVMAIVQGTFPDIFLMPEVYAGNRFYAYSYPFRDATKSELGTHDDAPLLYTGAHGCTRWDNKQAGSDGTPLINMWPQTYQGSIVSYYNAAQRLATANLMRNAFAKGDNFLGQCFSGQVTPVVQGSLMYRDLKAGVFG